MSEGEAAAVDAYLHHYFGLKSAGAAPAPATSQSRDPDEDAEFNAYMWRHFPSAAQG